jgi:hypothetical protein
MKVVTLGFALARGLSGCAVQKNLVPTGGSRSDGLVHTRRRSTQRPAGVAGATGLLRKRIRSIRA